MKNVLVVVDMQNDFIDGTLGTREAMTIVDKVVNVVSSFDGEVVFTRDTHFDNYLETSEGRKLPVIHCIKDTYGWQICDKLIGTDRVKKVFDKYTFGSVDLADYLKKVSDLETVTLVGLCTDICVISNALLVKANLPEIEINVLADCCAGVTDETHRNALQAMKMCQINII